MKMEGMGDINRQQGRGEMVPGTAAVHEKTQSREGKERPVERTLSSCPSIAASWTMPKPLPAWITVNCGQF